MGQRYRFGFQEEGDVLDPTFWVYDNNEMGAEFNGYLDRDNIDRATILQAEIVEDQFTTIDRYTSDVAFTPDRQAISWQGGGGNDADGLFRKEITCAADCVLSVEAHLTWRWDDAAWSMLSSGAVSPGETSTFRTNCLRFRLTVDGVDVCRTGFFDDTHRYYGTYLVGATVVTSGTHVVTLEVEATRRLWETLAIYNNNSGDVSINTRQLLVIQEKR